MAAVEGGRPVHRIDHRRDAFERVAHRQIRMVENRVQDRRRVREAGRLDDHAPEGRDAAVVALAQQVLEGGDEIAPHGAAEASGGEQHEAFLHRLDEEVVEADLAELVDDHDRVGERRILEETVEQRRLAGAEKARENREGDRRHAACLTADFTHGGPLSWTPLNRRQRRRRPCGGSPGSRWRRSPR
jgi:hypothetical protein